MKRLACALGLAVLTLTACAAGGGPPDTSDTPRRDLAERPTPLATDRDGTGRSPQSGPPGQQSTSDPGSGSQGAPRPGRSHRSGTPGDPESPSAGAAPFHGIAALTDPAHDAGLGAPPYADLRSLTLADNRTSLRVTVVLDGSLPGHTATGETMGIGVDLYPPGNGRESDYQLFADGEPDGWFAYLDTPDGFVRYPGTFGIGGSRIIFTVPWTSVGSPRIGRFSAFVDWSERSSAVTGNKASNDFAPTLGTKTYAR